MSEKVSSFADWKMRADLIKGAVTLGWNMQPEGTAISGQVGYFYIHEPFIQTYSACCAFDIESLNDLIKNGTSDYGTPEEIAHKARDITLHVLHERPNDPELTKAMFHANIVNFANTQTAKIATSHPQDLSHFGNLIYCYSDERTIMRPMAFNGERGSILSPVEVALGVLYYMQEDNKKHPDYFATTSLETAIIRILASYPQVEAYL